jgi:hypothetical protein
VCQLYAVLYNMHTAMLHDDVFVALHYTCNPAKAAAGAKYKQFLHKTHPANSMQHLGEKSIAMKTLSISGRCTCVVTCVGTAECARTYAQSNLFARSASMTERAALMDLRLCACGH